MAGKDKMRKQHGKHICDLMLSINVLIKNWFSAHQIPEVMILVIYIRRVRGRIWGFEPIQERQSYLQRQYSAQWELI